MRETTPQSLAPAKTEIDSPRRSIDESCSKLLQLPTDLRLKRGWALVDATQRSG
jgi:hypothetical protein